MARSVGLKWNANTDQVDGYNLYRGAAAGQENTKVNAAVIVGTTFTDPNPVVGHNFYIAKSVLNGIESLASNEVDAVLLPGAPTGLVVQSIT